MNISRNISRLATGISSCLLVALALPLSTFAAAPVVVTPSNMQGWTTEDTRANGHVTFVADSAAPLGSGALQLKTDTSDLVTSGQDKAQLTKYFSPIGLAGINDSSLSYSTKQVSAPFAGADAAYQLYVFVNGTTGFNTFTYEPYVNGGNAAIHQGDWQSWSVGSGRFYSSHNFTTATGSVVTSQGEHTYTLSELRTIFPSANVIGIGANIGSNNPGYNVETDGVNFNGTTYNFEQDVKTPKTKDDCKNDGYKNFTDQNRNVFRNQGKCIDYVNHHNVEIRGDVKYTAVGLNREAEFDMNTADNSGSFSYTDANNDWYKVKITDVSAMDKAGYFAGVVTKAKNPSYVGQTLFAKVADNHPDQIWGTFTDAATAKTGVANKLDPAGGAFDITHGNLRISSQSNVKDRVDN